MIYKKTILAAMLLVILMMGVVNASDDINANETLTIDDVEEISEVSLDEVISDSEDSFDVSYGHP